MCPPATKVAARHLRLKSRDLKRPFGEGTIPRSFQLVDTQLNTTGAVLHVYERVGPVKYGEVEVGQDTVIFE